MSPAYEKFIPLVKPTGHILDAGCGSGRDSKYFKNQGFTVTALDASEALVAIASQKIGQSVLHATFSDIDWGSEFDGIWCCASLLHVPKIELIPVFKKLATALKPGGYFYFSFKYGKEERQHNGRTFTDLNEAYLAELLTNIPNLKEQNVWVTGDQRVGREAELWLNAILEKV